MTQLFKNNAVSALVGAIAAGDTVFNVADGELFPTPAAGEFFLLTLIRLDTNGNESGWEIVKVTARTGNTLTVVRAQEGSAAQSWPDGTLVDARLTAGSLAGFTAPDSNRLAGITPSQDALTYLGASGAFGLRNKLINGDFSIWQRGSGFSKPNGNYTADRWIVAASDTVLEYTISKQAAAQPLAGWATRDIMRFATSNGMTVDQIVDVKQRIENVGTLQGEDVAVSFLHRFGSTAAKISVFYQQNFGSGGSAIASGQIGSAAEGSTDVGFARLTFTGTIPSVAGKTIGTGSYLELVIRVHGAALPANTYLDLLDVQLEAGEVATPFERRPIGLELSLCQRYFRELSGTVGRVDVNTTQAVFGISLIPSMRASPTYTFTGTGHIHEMSVAFRDIISIANASDDTGKGGYVRFNMASSGGAGSMCNLQGRVYASAEL